MVLGSMVLAAILVGLSVAVDAVDAMETND
jgi:hypothetical protein